MAYSFDQIFAADPANPANVAQNASVTIFAPGDATMTPLTITDPDGTPLPNPIPVNANGFGSAFAHATLDRVAWAGGGFTGFFTSYEGMKQVAVDAQAAAESAASNAAAEASTALAPVIADAETATAAANTAAANALAPNDSTVAEYVNGTGPTKAALNSTYALGGGTSRTITGPTLPALPPGTEYIWNKTDGAGTLLDIVSGVA
jgi:hypothetical protein